MCECCASIKLLLTVGLTLQFGKRWELWSFQSGHRLLLGIDYPARVVKAVWHKRVCFANKLSFSHLYRDVLKTLLFRWFSTGFASFIQAENFPHPLSRHRIIAILLCLDSGSGKFSAWINGAKPTENHRKVTFLIPHDTGEKIIIC